MNITVRHQPKPYIYLFMCLEGWCTAQSSVRSARPRRRGRNWIYRYGGLAFLTPLRTAGEMKAGFLLSQMLANQEFNSMQSSLLVRALIVGVIVACSDAYAEPRCVVFEHRDYQGASWWLDDGDSLLGVDGETICTTVSHCPSPPTPCTVCDWHEPSWNDVISSFTVDPDCTLTLWEHVDGGAYFRWPGLSYRYVGDNWNDEASRADCRCS